MLTRQVIFQYIILISILLKHWFYNLINLIKGGSPLKDLSSEIILITGAANGLGRSIAQQLAHFGCTLILWDVDEVNNVRVAQELNQATKSKHIHAMKCDLSSRESIYECAKKVQDTVGNVTMVINNAGIVSGKSLIDCSDASIQRTFDVNVLAHFWILKAFLPSMLDNNHGHIVTVSSIAGCYGVSKLVDYCSSKFAAVGLHEALTAELHSLNRDGIKTTLVCPTFINTDMFQGLTIKGKRAPVVEPEYIADKIIKAIRTNQHTLLVPNNAIIRIVIDRIAPMSAKLERNDVFGTSHMMDTFVGHQNKFSEKQ
ncbi:unnamed protein product [Adineta steineri]|uniref:Short-chain dehydrogenase/reductase 3 n=1 Tax=Adineta steineri TaxID=433720 RepID=A0A815Y669_9BILA|nr:unnamed protein product [Adineta steineri]CAF1666892.1 unnamed protein product [Adineta steineri]